MDKEQENNWRSADYNERMAIEAYSKDARYSSILNGSIFGGSALLCFIMFDLSLGAMRVNGESQWLKALIMFVIELIIIGSLLGYYIYCKLKRHKKVLAREYLVSSVEIIDKQNISGRSSDRGFYITIKQENGNTAKYQTSELTYSNASLTSQAILVKYSDEYISGYYDEYEVVVTHNPE